MILWHTDTKNILVLVEDGTNADDDRILLSGFNHHSFSLRLPNIRRTSGLLRVERLTLVMVTLVLDRSTEKLFIELLEINTVLNLMSFLINNHLYLSISNSLFSDLNMLFQCHSHDNYNIYYFAIICSALYLHLSDNLSTSCNLIGREGPTLIQSIQLTGTAIFISHCSVINVILQGYVKCGLCNKFFNKFIALKHIRSCLQQGSSSSSSGKMEEDAFLLYSRYCQKIYVGIYLCFVGHARVKLMGVWYRVWIQGRALQRALCNPL